MSHKNLPAKDHLEKKSEMIGLPLCV